MVDGDFDYNTSTSQLKLGLGLSMAKKGLIFDSPFSQVEKWKMVEQVDSWLE